MLAPLAENPESLISHHGRRQLQLLRGKAVAADGKEYKFTFQKIEGVKVGSVVDVTYTGTLGGPKPAMASNLNLSKSNIN